MPAPYTIQESSEISGLSVKFIRRLKDALPTLFQNHTDRGQANALLFDEEIVEVLKRIRSMKGKGKTLQQIRNEIASFVERRTEPTIEVEEEKSDTSDLGKADKQEGNIVVSALRHENEVLRSQVDLLQDLVRKAEERFDRLLPASPLENRSKQSAKSNLIMWMTEAVVVTVFAMGFIAMIWFFAQNAFVV